MNRRILLICFFLLTTTAVSEAGLPDDQMYSLYSQANQHFRQGNATNDSEEAERHYDKAILSFERIIDEGGIENAKLYYNLANAYFLRGQLGKAILNYRRAENLDDFDENIRKNLAFARSKSIDKIATKTEKRVLQTLFFWHYDFSVKTKFLLMCIFWAILCLCITGIIWLGRNTTWVVPAVICCILTLCFLVSVVVECKTRVDQVGGVILANEVTAHQGDGINYPLSFKEPLHEGTEFDLIEDRPGWLHIKLSDGSDGWITEDSAELI